VNDTFSTVPASSAVVKVFLSLRRLLVRNLFRPSYEAFKRPFERKQEALQEEARQQHNSLKPVAPSDDRVEVLPVSPAPLTPTALQKQARRARRLSQYEEVVRLHEQGANQVTIAALVGLNRDTVRRYLNAEGFPEITPLANEAVWTRIKRTYSSAGKQVSTM
jgi:Helix-turn-helix domain of resolvase